ncbi:MAG: AAA family ATPase [Sneathiella sp.]|nr:AAA family ATPase [Sneathiella sp.]
MAIALKPVDGSADTAEYREVIAFIDDGETETVIAEYLRRLGQNNSVVARGSLKDAIKFFTDHESPKVLIVDVSASDFPANDLESLANVCEPSVQVIVIGKRNDIGLFRDLVQMGIQDYLAKPLPYDLFSRSLHQALGILPLSQARQRAGKVIAILGARGGVGATTLLSNISWLIAEDLGRRVALIDLNLQSGTLGLSFNQKSNQGLSEILHNSDRLDPLFLERAMITVGKRLRILSSEEPLGSATELRANAVNELVRALQKQFHYVGLDMPSLINSDMMEVAKSADLRIVVVTSDIASVRDAARYINELDTGNPNGRTLLVLNNILPPQRGALKLTKIEAALNRKVDYEIPYAKTAGIQASVMGKPFSMQNGTATKAVRKLAHGLVGNAVIKPRRLLDVLRRKG